MTKFFQSYMGKKFYEADVPRLIRALERIANALERAAGEPTDAERAAAQRPDKSE
jgi:uncharacterized protein YukE